MLRVVVADESGEFKLVSIVRALPPVVTSFLGMDGVVWPSIVMLMGC